MAIRMQLKDGTRYLLTDDGGVIRRSDNTYTDSPGGSRQWIILGFLKRSHSRNIVPLQAALDGADVGFGYVVDLDHGTKRVWMSPSGHRLDNLYSRSVSETERA